MANFNHTPTILFTTRPVNGKITNKWNGPPGNMPILLSPDII